MWNVSLQGETRLWITGTALAAAALAAALPARAQYPGQITNANKNTPTLRAVAVLEWTGEADHPKASRIVPVCVYDGQELQDAGIYLARPEPLALDVEVEYQLQLDGKPVGLFDIENAAREQGAWVGYGKLKPLPKPKPAPVQVVKIDEYDDAQSDVPILHRKHHSGDSGSGGNSGSKTGSDSGQQGPPPDPDRPTLHKGGDASAGSTSGNSGSSSGDTSSSGTTSTQPSDPDRPTLHKSGDASTSTSTGSTGGDTGATSTSGTTSTESTDPDRPTLHRNPDTSTTSSTGSSSGSTSTSDSNQPKLKKKKAEDEGYVSDVATVTDSDRPHLFRGKSAGFGAPVLPSLMGLPPEMHQEVAVSDAQNQPLHVWDYIWANPDDENKMKAGMEDLARTALGLNPLPAPKPAPKKTAATTTHKTAKPAPPPPPPAPLLDEQFRVFELAYGSGATMVLSAHSDGAGAPMKFVTLIAQPDLYGDVAVLVKNVTDAAHLDDTPRMRLVDAVDAMADNRGELLFELRGATERQFALYRVLRGQATKLFVSSPDAIAASAAPPGN
jgi:outer membrane biosynthesis protein TonB